MTNFTSTTITATVDGQTFAGKPITVEDGDVIFSLRDDPMKLNKALVAATFDLTDEQVNALPWAAYQSMLGDALEVNGLKPKGETQAATELTSA